MISMNKWKKGSMAVACSLGLGLPVCLQAETATLAGTAPTLAVGSLTGTAGDSGLLGGSGDGLLGLGLLGGSGDGLLGLGLLGSGGDGLLGGLLGDDGDGLLGGLLGGDGDGLLGLGLLGGDGDGLLGGLLGGDGDGLLGLGLLGGDGDGLLGLGLLGGSGDGLLGLGLQGGSGDGTLALGGLAQPEVLGNTGLLNDLVGDVLAALNLAEVLPNLTQSLGLDDLVMETVFGDVLPSISHSVLAPLLAGIYGVSATLGLEIPLNLILQPTLNGLTGTLGATEDFLFNLLFIE